MNVTGKISLYLLLIAGYLLIGPSIALGCTCDLPQVGKKLKQQVAEARNKSKAVFAGKVVEVIDNPQTLYVDVKLKVERSWKQAYTDEVTIRTGRGSGDCGYRFEVGESYLVYAYSSDENKLETNICQRTRRLVEAKEDLKLLGDGRPPSKNQEQQASKLSPCPASKVKRSVEGRQR